MAIERLTLLLAITLHGAAHVAAAKARVAVEFAADATFAPPAGWTPCAENPDTAIGRFAPFDVIFALRQPGLYDALPAILDDVATPGSPSYARWWTADQVRARFAPKDTARGVTVVADFAREHGGIVRDADAAAARRSGFLAARFPRAALAERAFGVELPAFCRAADGAVVRRATASYTLPRAVADVVEFVGGLVRFPPPLRPRTPPIGRPLGREPGNFTVTPALIRRQYGVDAAAVAAAHAAGKDNIQGVVSFLSQYFSPEDYATSRAQFKLPTHPIDKVIGPNNATRPGVEASLDVQFLFGVGGDLPAWVWSTPGQQPDNPGSEPFLTWLHAVSAHEGPLPSVFSISYQDYEDTVVSPGFMDRVSAEFAKLGLRGITIVTGSGDWGVGCSPDGTSFRPDFPSSSPYIVSTGATTFCTKAALPSGCAPAGPFPAPEAGAAFSSGGFSDHFAQPKFQAAAVGAFLKQTTVPRSFFNASGRGFPDVGALGVHFDVVYKGHNADVAGTSAATPTFAAIVSLLNGARLAAGQPTMGYILPFLYSAAAKDASAFNDVTEGTNPHGACPGFACVAGWNPMTGLGSPWFPSLRRMALAAAEGGW